MNLSGLRDFKEAMGKALKLTWDSNCSWLQLGLNFSEATFHSESHHPVGPIRCKWGNRACVHASADLRPVYLRPEARVPCA